MVGLHVEMKFKVINGLNKFLIFVTLRLPISVHGKLRMIGMICMICSHLLVIFDLKALARIE